MWLYLFIANVHYLLSMISMKLASMIWLEANTERSESNPGRSLGLYKARRDGCLEDSTPLICSFTFGSVRTRSKGSRITLMRRILSFSRILFLLVLPLDIGFTTDCFCGYTALDSCLVVLLFVKVYCNEVYQAFSKR